MLSFPLLDAMGCEKDEIKKHNSCNPVTFNDSEPSKLIVDISCSV
jgi:hypothetical protein